MTTTIEGLYQNGCERPDAPAMIYNNQTLTYRRFYQQIRAARDWLQAQGVGEGGVGVIWTTLIPDGWILILALRSLGITTVAISTPREIARLAELDLRWITTTEGAKPQGFDGLPDVPGVRRLVLPSAIFGVPDSGAPLPPPEPVDPAAHIILTSGTTGRYKMVRFDASVEQARVRYSRAIFTDLLDIGGVRLFVHVLNFNLYTAAGYMTAMTAWPFGDAVAIYEGNEPWTSYNDPRLTHAIVTPHFLQRLMTAPEGALKRNENLQLLVVGGAAPTALTAQAKARLTPKVASVLGSTEAGFWAFTPLETPDDQRWHRVHPSRTLQVVDEDHKVLPPHTLGQLRVKIEDGLYGYYDDAEATAEFFRDGYMYPGDLAMLDEQGRVSLFGRVNDVINVLGDKRPAQPYEQALVDALGVTAACVFTLPGAQGEELHVAIETPRPIPQEALAAAIAPVFKDFPRAHFHFVADLPRNHNGKIQRFVLKQALMGTAAAA